MQQDWSARTTNKEAYHRAGGRRRVNRKRQIEAINRQVMALNLWWYHKLSNAKIAEILGVHRTTVWRYKRVLFQKPGYTRHIKRSFTLSYVAGRGWRAYGYE